MKKSKLKIMLILSVFLALAMILCIFIFKNPKDKQEYNIDKKEAKILEIENKKIYDYCRGDRMYEFPYNICIF